MNANAIKNLVKYAQLYLYEHDFDPNTKYKHDLELWILIVSKELEAHQEKLNKRRTKRKDVCI